MRVNIRQLGRLQPDQRADDLVHVAARAEVVAGAGEDDDLDVARVAQPLEQVAQLGVRVEGERVLALGAVQRDRGDAAAQRPLEVLPAIARERAPVAGGERRVEAGDGNVGHGVSASGA
jgi:hypothetical protein